MSVGDRICYNSDFGTVRFRGAIQGKPGQWVGIEWDDPARGKGDGLINGVRYFQSRSPTGASFLRSSAPSLHFGCTFIAALHEKYLEDLHGASTKESIVLGSSDGAIEVEAVDMNKVRNKFAQLGKLKEVGLENYMISKAGSPREIESICPNIRRLDLSKNLFVSWVEIVAIVEQLRVLESLTLHYNVFQELSSSLIGSCKSILHLSLNRTGVTWEQATLIASAFPSLKQLELGFNDLSSLDSPASSDSINEMALELLAMDGNALTKWDELIGIIKGKLPHLHTLMLSENQIDRIPRPSSSNEAVSSIDNIVLDGNPINDWTSIDALAEWFPGLTTLRAADLPLFNNELSKYGRQLIIGRLGSLSRFNSTKITEEERKDAEVFYLNWIVKNTERSQRADKHPRWTALVQLHGEPEEGAPSIDTGRLQSRLMTVEVYRLFEAPQNPVHRPEEVFQQTLQVLPNMPVKTLRLKLLKTFKAKPNTEMRVFMKLKRDSEDAGVWGEIDLSLTRQSDLVWWGVEHGSHLGVVLP